MPILDPLVIRLTGDSGDGVQLVGEQLTISAALAGKNVRTLPDFPAEIRAPAGTVAGVSGFQLAIAEQAIFTAGESLDVLVTLNPAALKNSLQFLNPNGLLIVNEDSMQQKDWDKAGLSSDFLESIQENYQIISLPLIKNTLEALSKFNISHSEAKKSKNFYVLGMVLWLFDLSIDHCLDFIEHKFKKNPEILMANKEALKAGYNYSMTLELIKRPYVIGDAQREKGDYRQITGVEAVSLGLATLATISNKKVLVAGYPITPASAILEECAKLQDFGVELLQAEDEIAACCACLGASFAGNLALTCTSGPGMDLKSESIGLGVACELPLVILDVSRAGASTGLPTKTGQSDLRLAMYGRHGESPLTVLAPKSPADCFYTIIEAFKIAIKYMTPVIVLMDAYLAVAAEPWQIPSIESLDLPEIIQNQNAKPFARNENLSRSWNTPGTPGFIYQLGGLEKHGDFGQVSYDANNHQHMVDIRLKKIENTANEYSPLEVEGNLKAKILLLGFGSTYGSLKTATLKCQEDGIEIACLNLRYLNPFPNELTDVLRKYDTVLVAELNTGQLVHEIRAKYLIDAKSITQCNGQPFAISFLVNKIKEVTNGAIYE